MENKTFISLTEGEEVSASAALPDGLYEFKYQGVTNGQHEPTDHDPKTYPTGIVDMLVYMPDGHTEQRKETFKLLDTKYNQQRIASLFRALGEPVGPNGKVKAKWSSFIGRKGWMKLETKKMNNGGDWQGMTFIFPENVEAEKQKYHYQASAAIQPVQPVQPAWQAQPTQNPAATSTTWNSGTTKW